MKLFLPINYLFFCVTNKINVKAILSRSKRLYTILGITLRKTNLKGLNRLLAKCNQRAKNPTAFKNLPTAFKNLGTAFKGVLRLRRLFVK